MLEAAFSVEWLARSSLSSNRAIAGEQEEAQQGDLNLSTAHGGRHTANTSEESHRSPTKNNQGLKPQRRPLETHRGPACRANAPGAGDTESKTGDWAERRRLRTIFTVDQVRSLELSFQQQQYPGSFVRRTLAGDLRLSEAQVKTWFQNRRMKLKQQLQVAQAEAFKSRLVHQYFSHPYHSVHSLNHTADSISFPEFGPLRHPTCTSDHFLPCPDHRPNLPRINTKAITN